MTMYMIPRGRGWELGGGELCNILTTCYESTAHLPHSYYYHDDNDGIVVVIVFCLLRSCLFGEDRTLHLLAGQSFFWITEYYSASFSGLLNC